jgi:hypothetical protein
MIDMEAHSVCASMSSSPVSTKEALRSRSYSLGRLVFIRIIGLPGRILGRHWDILGMALASLVAISGPKKVSIFRAHPFQCPNNVARLKTITYRAI